MVIGKILVIKENSAEQSRPEENLGLYRTYINSRAGKNYLKLLKLVFKTILRFLGFCF